MPVYEYACKGCGHEFEREQRITEKPLKKCPECGAMKAKRLISRTSFVLKGGGWYNDLYASPKPGSGSSEKGGEKSEGKADAGGEKPAKSDAPAKGDGKSDGKGSKTSKKASKAAA